MNVQPMASHLQCKSSFTKIHAFILEFLLDAQLNYFIHVSAEVSVHGESHW
jgi:hypothetical protein